jgi:hypothetical protein
MSYIGVQPTPVPLQSSQLAENLVVPNLTVAGGATVGGVLAANKIATYTANVSIPYNVSTTVLALPVDDGQVWL